MNEMYKKPVLTVIICIMIGFTVMTQSISSMTLCGGTLMQIWHNLNNCTDTQLNFMGYSSGFIGRELAGVIVLIAFLILSVGLLGLRRIFRKTK